MSTFQFDLQLALVNIIERFPDRKGDLAHFLQKQIWAKEDRKLILNILAQMLLYPQTTEEIAIIVLPVIPELVTRIIDESAIQGVPATLRFPLIVCAFSKLISITPHISNLILEYFRKSPSILQSLDRHQIASSADNGAETEEMCLELVKAVYRFLKFSMKDFSALWTWSPLFPLLQQSNEEIRAFVCQCLVMVLGISDQRVHNSEFCKKLLIECNYIMRFDEDEARLQQRHLEIQKANTVEIKQIENRIEGSIVTGADLGSRLVDVSGFLLPIKQEQKYLNQDRRTNLVMTATTQRNIESLTLAISQGAPILLQGPPGSGKTSAVDYLSKVTGNHSTLLEIGETIPKLIHNSDMIKIHLGDQSDAKILLGTYICTDVPGEFHWVSGALTQAVTEGRWILIEDIDMASTEVLSVLIPLLEKRQLFIPGRGEVIDAAEGFQIFATQTLHSHGHGGKNIDILSSYWTRVIVEPLGSEELTAVLRYRFSPIEPLIAKIIETFEMLQRAQEASPTPPTLSSTTEPVVTTEGQQQPPIPKLRSGRFISIRDVTKWCSRVEDAVKGSDFNNGLVSSQVREVVFLEAVDCFCCAIAKGPLRRQVVDLIAKIWQIETSRVEYFITSYKPQLNVTKSTVNLGRVVQLPIYNSDNSSTQALQLEGDNYCYTRHSLVLMERLAQCLKHEEPILLVGETGCGKTSTIQHLAKKLNQKLIVLNLNQQSDSADLLGGFRPVELRLLCVPLKKKFDALFTKTFSKKANAAFLEKVHQFFANKDWRKLIMSFRKALQMVKDKIFKEQEEPERGEEAQQRKKAKDNKPQLREEWIKFEAAVSKFDIQQDQIKNNFAFSFVEGALIKAIKKGQWVLLDEINLASAETLESLSGLLEGGSIVLTERGDVTEVPRHNNFRLFGSMNPANDFGKKDLPATLRNRFTEFYVDDMEDPDDLKILIQSYLKTVAPGMQVDNIVEFYLGARAEAAKNLTDGANQRPHFSLRTLSRTLEFTKRISKQYGYQRALHEGACMSFLTQLDTKSYPVMREIIKKHLQKGIPQGQLNRAPNPPSESYVRFDQFWIEKGTESIIEDPRYILTTTIQTHLNNLARIAVARNYPVLLQGPTSAGKTSMVQYLAKKTGHRMVRINNHEHTDIQEYLGQYTTDPQTGQLKFQEGILVEAVRNGYWIVLDELNLAPSEVLEALNRLLDDNRELFIPDTQQVIKPHPSFMLFATQNPPGIYGGRKVLSRAFRNRFLELHFDDIPDDELQIILKERCAIPESYAKKLIAIMKDLQRHRQGSKVFAGKHGFITLRDLFKWAERHPHSYEQLGVEGYMLLAERLRNHEEKLIVKKVLQEHLKITLDIDRLYESETNSSDEFQRFSDLLQTHDSEMARKVVWTQSMKRLFTLVGRCLRYKEPVLLVGETGTGKTMICELWSWLLNQHMQTLNCHQHTETQDFLGGLRPVRGKEKVTAQLDAAVRDFISKSTVLQHNSEVIHKYATVQVDQLSGKDLMIAFEEILPVVFNMKVQEKEIEASSSLKNQLAYLIAKAEEIRVLEKELQTLFAWYDGPLVQAMKTGQLLLVDEISLAEDAVLERLNSVLEPSRTLTLAEKGGEAIEEIVAHSDFRVLATMNPGGDFGKKELSPALRNRFTEIYVPQINSREDLCMIIEERFTVPALKGFGDKLLDFVEWFSSKQVHKNQFALNLRDILAWVEFLNRTLGKNTVVSNPASAPQDVQSALFESYLHGASLVLLDGLGITHTLNNQSLKRESINFLLSQVPENLRPQLRGIFLEAQQLIASPKLLEITADEDKCQIGPFAIEKGPVEGHKPQKNPFTLHAPTTSCNVLRLLRALQLPKPILLEGSPGVGKTTLVEALGAWVRRRVARINFSDQTDLLDLLGQDLPIPAEETEVSQGPKFQWMDGVFLSALKAGDWVLLDEMNLASQSVLEGLNSCLDHRKTIFIPELNQTFQCPPTFRIFACQNPTQQGGGRKGLPKSYLNRFTKVYVDKFDTYDLVFIASNLYPQIDRDDLSKMITFNQELHKDTMELCKYGRKGSPWEFNLRDILRWCQLVTSNKTSNRSKNDPAMFVDLLYLQRMRDPEDRDQIKKLFHRVFGRPLTVDVRPHFHVTPTYVQIGNSFIARNTVGTIKAVKSTTMPMILQGTLNPLENLIQCVNERWMSILIGNTASMKTTLVKLLADLTGNTLHTFSINAQVDTTELLGSFEQVDLNRHKKDVVDQAQALVRYISESVLFSTPDEAASQLEFAARVSQVSELHNVWSMFNARSKFTTQTTRDAAFDDEQYKMLNQVLNFIENCINKFSLNVDADQVALIRTRLERLQKLKRTEISGQFEWIDGLLIRAMERGEWLVLENVNLCPSSVVDRLNPLLEPNGKLLINERGLLPDGEYASVQPHPNFRMFMVMDPKNGEISRAMRNRGIEICLLPPKTMSRDTEMMLENAGVNGTQLVEQMMHFHYQMKEQFTRGRDNVVITLRSLLQWAQLLNAQLQRGFDFYRSLELSMEEVYLRSRKYHSERVAIKALFDKCFENFQMLRYDKCVRSGLQWRKYPLDSSSATLNRQASFFIHKFGQLLHAKSTDPVDALVAQLIYCGKYMMQTASSNDWILRYNWLKVHFNNYNSAAPVLDSLVFSFEHFIKHSLLAELSGVLTKIVDGSQVNPDLFKYQPVDLRVNEPLFAYLRESLLAKADQSPESQQLWKYFESLLERTDILFLITIQLFKEQRVASQFSKKSASRFSPIEQSYEIATQRQAATSDPLVTILATLFASLDETVQQWLTTGYPQVVDIQTTKAIKSVVRTRNQLWQSLTIGNAVNLSDFKLRWLHLIRQLTQLVSQSKTTAVPLALSDKLNAVVTKMNQLLRDKGSIYAKNNLWRHEGHPVIFHSEELLHLYDKLVTLAKGFEVDSEIILKSRHKLAFYLDEDIKRTLVHSICSLYWLNGVMLREMFNDKSSSVKQSPANALFESLTKIPDTLSKKVADLKKSVNDPSITPESTQKYLLVPIYDHYSIVLEYFILSRLFATSKAHDLGTVDEEIKPMLPLIERLIDFSLAYSTRAPLDLVPLQQLFWIYQPAQRDSQDIRTAREMLPTLLQELFASFNNRVWNNTFNKSLAVIKEQITGSKLSAEINTSYVEGCVKLAHSVQTAFIIPLLSSWREVTIGNRDYKLSQVNELSLFLLSASSTEALLKSSGSRDNSDTHIAEWRLLTSLLTTVIHSFESTYTPDNWATIRNLLAEVAAVVTDAKDTTSVSDQVQQLTTLLATSDDAKFTELQSTYLHPCLALLSEHQSSKKDTGADRSVRGKAWTWLGQLRLHLLLPSLNVDPTAKYRMKMSLIDQQIFDVECELEAVTGIEKHMTGKDKTSKIDILHDEKEVMQKLRQKLRQKVVQRPKPELFDALFKELHSFSTSNGSKDKILGLMKEMDDLANPQNRPFVVQQESLWQANMLYFVERLVEHYWSFRDVIQPIINAVYQIKFGVRKLLNAKLESIPVHKLGLAVEDINAFVREPYYRPLEHVQDVMQYLLSYSHFSNLANDSQAVVGDGLANIQNLLDVKTFDALAIVSQVTKMQPLIKALEYNHKAATNDAVKVIYSLLLRVSLCKIYEHIVNQNYISSRILKVLDKIFVTFVDTWDKFKEEEAKRLLEEQQTFKYREKKQRQDIIEIGDDPNFKTQDVVEEEKFQKSFPTFQDEFAEILEEIGNSIMNAADENSEKESKDDEEQPRTDDKKKIDVLTQPTPEEEYLVETANLRDNEVNQLCKVHHHLFATIKAHMGTTTLKFNEEEKRETLFLMYTSCAEILKVLNYQLSEKFDMQDQFKASHMVAIQKINEYFDATKNNLSKLDLAQVKSASILHSGLIENFYTAPNVAEVSLIKAPLENFKFQIMKLLEEFNDNGILIQIQKIIEKLMTFGIRSSLYKVLIGLELLLEKANGWEQNAPQRYSIRTHMDVITSIISRWRRLELQYWPVLLDAKQQEFVCKANQAWLALYQLVVLGQIADVPSIQKVLEEYIENTSFGEFESRLNHLLAFYNQFDTELTLGFTRFNYLSEEIRVKIKNTLFNLYNYYKQFVPALRTAIEKEFTPIQQKLKEFIKLSKWEDSNYYRLAKSIDLSHRTLNKFANNYEEILEKPMVHVFTKVGEIDFDNQKDFGYQDETDIIATKIGLNTEEEPKNAKGKKARKTKRNKRHVDAEFDLSELKSTDFVVAENVAEKYLVNVAQSPLIPHEIITLFKLTDDSSKVPKTDRLFKKMKKYCIKDILPKQLYWGAQLYFVDQYAIDIIARALQLKTNQNTKIAAKKYALVELLRTLNNKLGLSWHKAAIDNDQLNVSHLLQLESFSSLTVNSSKTMDPRKFEALQLLWDKSEQYYFKNLIRIVKLRQNVGRHSLDLSQNEVRKSSGFIEHLFNIILKQRSMLKKLGDEYKNLDRFVTPLTGLMNVEEPLKLTVPPQQATKSAAIAQKALFDEMVEKLTDLSILLQSLTDGISQRQEVEKQLGAMKAQCEDAKSRLARHIASFVDKSVEASDQHSFLATNAVAVAVHEAASNFAQIKQAFSAHVVPNMPRSFLTPFNEFFDQAQTRMEQCATSIAPSQETLESQNEAFADEFNKELNGLISTVLVAIQNVMNVQGQITREEDERRKKVAEERQREKEARAAREAAAREAAAAKEGEEKKPEEDKMEEDSEPEFNEPDIDQNIPNLHDKFEKLFDSLLMERVNAYFKRVNDSMAKFSNSKALSLNNVSTLLTRSAAPLFMQYKKLVDLLFLDMISLHKSLSKLEYVLVNVLNTLLLRGFCKQEETTEGEGEGEGEITELQEGTGLGDGKGQKDISEDLKLEDEDKIMGEKQKDKEEKPEEQEENPDDKQEDTGIEMDAEFDGQLHDVEDQEDKEDDDNQNDDESAEHEKQMGDLNRDKEEVVDERMWNSEDEDDENEDGDNQEDTYEKDAPMPTNKKSETELGAKPEDEKKKPKKDEKAADGEEKDDAGEKGEDGEQGSEEEKDDEGDEEDKDENEETGDNEEKVGAENIEDNHHVKPKEEEKEFELDDNMQLDGDEPDEKEGEGEGEGQDGEDDMDEGEGDLNDFKEGENAEKEEENKQEEEVNVPEEGLNLDAKDEQEEEEMHDEEKGDKATEENPEENKQEDEAPNVEANLQKDDEMEEDPYKNQQENVFGVKDNVGKTSENVQVSEDNQQREAQEQQNEQESRDNVQNAPDDQYRADQQNTTTSSSAQNEQKKPNKPKQKEPNPYRSLGDALKHWEKKLNMSETTETKDEEKNGEDNKEEEEYDENENVNKEQLFEYLMDDAQKQDAQTLGSALEEQQEELPKESAFPEEEKKEEEPEQDEGPKKEEQEQVTNDEKKSNKKSSSTHQSIPLFEDQMDIDEDQKEQDGDKKDDEDQEGDEERKDNDEAMQDLTSDGMALENNQALDQLQAQALQEFTVDDLNTMREELDTMIGKWREDATNAQMGMKIWKKMSATTAPLAAELCEQLRLILEPTLKSKLQGDYRSGKRLNMRKVIPYIASNFRKDKIWLRRTKPNTRNYQVMLTVDDSESVAHGGAGALLREAVAVIATALQTLNIGEISVAKFGQAVELLHPFHLPFSDEQAARVIPQLSFKQKSTNIEELLLKTVQMLELCREENHTMQQETAQLMFVISDGKFGDRRAPIREWLRRATEHNIFVVFLVIDNSEESILDIKKPVWKGAKMEMTNYIDEFPFPYYIILRKIQNLPTVLADALRQWFELIQRK